MMRLGTNSNEATSEANRTCLKRPQRPQQQLYWTPIPGWARPWGYGLLRPGWRHPTR
jgi:hypothetical protein